MLYACVGSDTLCQYTRLRMVITAVLQKTCNVMLLESFSPAGFGAHRKSVEHFYETLAVCGRELRVFVQRNFVKDDARNVIGFGSGRIAFVHSGVQLGMD